MKMWTLIVLLVCGVMRADTFRLFELGDFPTTNGKITGTILVDVTQGKAVSGNITLTELWPGGPVSVNRKGFMETDAPCGAYCEFSGGNAGQTDFGFSYINPAPNEPYLNLHLTSAVSLIDWHGELCWNAGFQCPGADFSTGGADFGYWTPPFVDDEGLYHPPFYTGDVVRFGGTSSLNLISEFQTTPEPASFVLLGTGAIGAIGAAYKRRKNTSG